MRQTRYLSYVLKANRFLRQSTMKQDDKKALKVCKALIFASTHICWNLYPWSGMTFCHFCKWKKNSSDEEFGVEVEPKLLNAINRAQAEFSCWNSNKPRKKVTTLRKQSGGHWGYKLCRFLFSQLAPCSSLFWLLLFFSCWYFSAKISSVWNKRR